MNSLNYMVNFTLTTNFIWDVDDDTGSQCPGFTT